MKHLKAGDIMTTPVMTTSKKASALNVARHLLSGLYTGMPVVNDELKVIGVVTEIDLLEALLEDKNLDETSAEELMTKEAVTADVNTPIGELMATMKQKNIIRIPITRDGKLVGIVARRDILRNLVAPVQVIVL